MDDLARSKELLEQLFAEVKKQEGTLAGGEKLGTGGKALKSLLQTRILFGNPNDRLTRLTPKLFKSVGLPLDDIQKRQLADCDFYYMTLAVNLFGAPGVQFKELICELDFGPKGMGEPIIQTMFPTGEWHDVLTYGAALGLGLDANLAWKAALNVPEDVLAKLKIKLPGSIAVNVENKDSYKGWIAVPEFSFSIGRKEIAAVGAKNSLCRWTISEPKLHKEDTVEFGVVFKVPKGCKSIELTGKALAQPSVPWLAAKLDHLFQHLSAKVKKVVEGKKDTPIGDHEQWIPLRLRA